MDLLFLVAPALYTPAGLHSTYTRIPLSNRTTFGMCITCVRPFVSPPLCAGAPHQPMRIQNWFGGSFTFE